MCVCVVCVRVCLSVWRVGGEEVVGVSMCVPVCVCVCLCVVSGVKD